MFFFFCIWYYSMNGNEPWDAFRIIPYSNTLGCSHRKNIPKGESFNLSCFFLAFRWEPLVFSKYSRPAVEFHGLEQTSYLFRSLCLICLTYGFISIFVRLHAFGPWCVVTTESQNSMGDRMTNSMFVKPMASTKSGEKGLLTFKVLEYARDVRTILGPVMGSLCMFRSSDKLLTDLSSVSCSCCCWFIVFAPFKSNHE